MARPSSSAEQQPQPGEASSLELVSRLSLMMFVQYGALGFWAVTIGTYIGANTGELGAAIFDSGFIGVAATASALGGLISPALLGVVADRWFSTEKLLALLHLLCAFFLVGMYASQHQWLFYFWIVMYFHAYVPTVTLTNGLALRHLKDRDRTFPIVRAIGTAGWVVAGLIVGLVMPAITGESIEATVIPIGMGVVAQVAMAAYCLTLPKTPPLSSVATGWRSAFGGSLWTDPRFGLFIFVSMLAAISSQYYNSYMNVFLNDRHYDSPAALQTVGQVTEVACMVALPWLLLRFGLKRLFIIGTLAWTVRFLMLAYSDVPGLAWVVLPALAIHGICYTFVYTTGQMYADQLTDPENRNAAQGVHQVVTGGIGHLLGALMAGWSQSIYLTPTGVDPAPYDWRSFWWVPTLISIAAAGMFMLAFRKQALGSDSQELQPDDSDLLVAPSEVFAHESAPADDVVGPFTTKVSGPASDS